jgi:hypothetical protein
MAKFEENTLMQIRFLRRALFCVYIFALFKQRRAEGARRGRGEEEDRLAWCRGSVSKALASCHAPCSWFSRRPFPALLALQLAEALDAPPRNQIEALPGWEGPRKSTQAAMSGVVCEEVSITMPPVPPPLIAGSYWTCLVLTPVLALGWASYVHGTDVLSRRRR